MSDMTGYRQQGQAGLLGHLVRARVTRLVALLALAIALGGLSSLVANHLIADARFCTANPKAPACNDGDRLWNGETPASYSSERNGLSK